MFRRADRQVFRYSGRLVSQGDFLRHWLPRHTGSSTRYRAYKEMASNLIEAIFTGDLRSFEERYYKISMSEYEARICFA